MSIDVVPGREPDAQEAALLYESGRSGVTRHHALRGYYAVKLLLPRRAQIAARRVAARRQRGVRFPRWPAEDALLRRRTALVRDALQATGADSLSVVAPWPDGARFAYVLTHDVETRAGADRIAELLEIERRHGLVSSWNFCGDWYPVTERDLALVREAGGEVGLHGLKHDGHLFDDHATFRSALPAIHERMTAWGAVGFRSPALRRNAAWIHELPCAYDSSFPDTDPFEPQPGGCCAIHPFFFGEVVELPLTLAQDFVLFDILGERSIRLWIEKAEWIAERYGLVNLLVHPDYMTLERLRLYDDFLEHLAAMDRGWHALPRDVAAWWRVRDGLRCVTGPDGVARVEGQVAEHARCARARVVDDRVVIDA